MNLRKNDECIALIRDMREGKEEAFSELLSMYTPMLKSVLSKYALEDNEYFSDASMALYKAAMNFDLNQDSVTFGLYAKICVNHRVLDLLRQIGKDEQAFVSQSNIDTVAVSDGTLQRLVREEELARLCKLARDVLSSLEYEVFMKWLHGERSADIASHLGITAKACDNAKSRIITKLRLATAEKFD